MINENFRLSFVESFAKSTFSFSDVARHYTSQKSQICQELSYTKNRVQLLSIMSESHSSIQVDKVNLLSKKHSFHDTNFTPYTVKLKSYPVLASFSSNFYAVNVSIYFTLIHWSKLNYEWWHYSMVQSCIYRITNTLKQRSVMQHAQGKL